MADNRELGVLEIYERIKADRTTIGLTSFKRNPKVPVLQTELPCVVLLERNDTILTYSSRSKVGYPARRQFEIQVELITNSKVTPDIRAMFKLLRKAVFKVRGTSNPEQFSNIIAENLYFLENRTEGPLNYGLPDIDVMRLILDLFYIDEGF